MLVFLKQCRLENQGMFPLFPLCLLICNLIFLNAIIVKTHVFLTIIFFVLVFFFNYYFLGVNHRFPFRFTHENFVKRFKLIQPEAVRGVRDSRVRPPSIKYPFSFLKLS